MWWLITLGALLLACVVFWVWLLLDIAELAYREHFGE